MRTFALLLPLLCAACFQLQISHTWVEDPIPEDAVAFLRPGETDLGRALSVLGAPHLVWEYREDGIAMAWGWVDQWAPGFTFSYNVNRFAPSARFSMSWDTLDWNGVVLFFGPDLVLERAERGFLRELVRNGRQRPAPVDEDH